MFLHHAVNLVSSNPCVVSSPRIKISFHVLSTCTDEIISAHIMTFFPWYRQVMNIMSENQFLFGSCYSSIYLDQRPYLALQIQISNYLMYNMCLNFLVVHLVCRKYMDLLLFYGYKCYFLLNSFH